MPLTLMNLKILLPFQIFADKTGVSRIVEQEFLILDEQEQSMRSVMTKLEAGFLRRFANFQHE
jgi:F-type H+-transporting ATPase subunit epsilon